MSPALSSISCINEFFHELLSKIIKVLLLWELYERCIIYIYSTQGKSLKMLWVFFVLVPLDKVLFKILGWTPSRLCLWWTDVQCNIIFSCFCQFWDVMHRPPRHPPLPSLTTIYCTFYSWHWFKIYNICLFPLHWKTRKSIKVYNYCFVMWLWNVFTIKCWSPFCALAKVARSGIPYDPSITKMQ